MATARRRLRTIRALARGLSEVCTNHAGEADDVELTTLACIWLSEQLDGIGDADAVRRRVCAKWERLELERSAAEYGAALDDLAQVSRRVDPLALASDIDRHHAGSRAALAAHEWMLVASNSRRRSSRGVFTTPDALARFLVESADRRLREEFGLADGLADDSTWAEVSARTGAAVPPGVSPALRFVRILDPATGSGVFPLAVASSVRATLLAKWRATGLSAEEAEARWTDEAAPELADALVLHELLPVPRALARWHLAELFGDATPNISSANPLSTHESLPFPITVTLGNPPYSVRAGSLDESSRALVAPYRFVDGEKLVEKGALRLEMHLQDDYVKFIRLAELQVERAGVGVVALVTNSSYLDSPSLRGMRASLAASFDRLELLDLHGARTRSTEALREAGDQNIFGIAQGIATLVGSTRTSTRGHPCVTHGELVGPRLGKLRALDPCPSDDEIETEELSPAGPGWYFRPRDTRYSGEYERWIGLKELFQRSISGIVTAHDRVVVALNDDDLLERARQIANEDLGLEELREELAVRDNAGWNLETARARFQADPNREACLRDYAYRPFDTRRILYHPALVWCDRRKLMCSLGEAANVALVVCRQLASPPWRHVFATRDLVDDNFISNRSRERSHTFPLYRRLDPSDASSAAASPLISNLDPDVVERLLPSGLQAKPEEVLDYIYAVLHSPSYRERHSDSLTFDFPRIPPVNDEELFLRFAKCGRELLRAHLSIGRLSEQSFAASLKPVGDGEPVVARGFPKWDSNRVWLNPGFALESIPEAVWNFAVGSYSPCRKWLKDRVGVRWTEVDRDSYSRLIGGIEESLRVLGELEGLALPATFGTLSCS